MVISGCYISLTIVAVTTVIVHFTMCSYYDLIISLAHSHSSFTMDAASFIDVVIAGYTYRTVPILCL